MTRKTAVVALALLLALASAGCGRSRDALTIYSGRTQNLVGQLLERFNQQTGIAIDVKYGDSAELALLLAEEGDRSPADVFFSQSPGATGFLAGKGRLARLDAGLLAKVDQRFHNRDGRWVGVSGRQRVLVYNTELVAERDLPDSVLELTDDRFTGKVALAPSNGSFQDFVTAMRQLEGEDATSRWLKAMAGNKPRTYANNNAVVEAVSRGEVPMGLVNHYYNYRFQQENPDTPSRNHVFADGEVGALVIPSTASVLAGSGKTDEAARFVEFLLSPEAQRYFSEQTFEYPLVQGIPAASGLPPLASLHSPDYDVDALGGGLEGTVKLIRSSGFNGV
ncbi:MAG TPA: iron ABC transporter substrate-binding protein [Actinomycetes bacterium]|jgi:iron(III) transport system substrate-binding protein|nr:iron ABC transporter substrate-binding protein [Actinomycetes bacterium]